MANVSDPDKKKRQVNFAAFAELLFFSFMVFVLERRQYATRIEVLLIAIFEHLAITHRDVFLHHS